VRTNVLEEHIASIIRMKRTIMLGTTLAVISNFLHNVLQLVVTANTVPSLLALFTLMMYVIHSSEKSVITRATWCHVTGEGILHSQCCENLKYYKISDI
jgi:uncharacterized membrane protein